MRRSTVAAIVLAFSATAHAEGQERITISCTRGNPNISMTIENTIGTALRAWMMAGSREMEIGTIDGPWLRPSISLVTDADGAYVYQPADMPGVVAGSADPWTIIVPPGGFYTVRLAATDFLDVKNGVRFDPAVPQTIVARLAVRRRQDHPGPPAAYTMASPALRLPDCTEATAQ